MQSKEIDGKKNCKRAHNFIDLVGQRFNRLLVKSLLGTRKTDGRLIWGCVCDCGKQVDVPGTQLRRNITQSCGCLLIERTKQVNTRHGKHGTRVYRIWSGMKNRCLNPNNADFEAYAGRGITLCAEWVDFENFYADMGDPPTDQHTIERKDNNQGYCKENCVWLLGIKQASNRRSSVKITVAGETRTSYEWDRHFGYFPGTVAKRIRNEWDPEKAVLTPIDTRYSVPQSTKHSTSVTS